MPEKKANDQSSIQTVNHGSRPEEEAAENVIVNILKRDDRIVRGKYIYITRPLVRVGVSDPLNDAPDVFLQVMPLKRSCWSYCFFK